MQVSANVALVKSWMLHGVYWGSYAAPGHDPGLVRSSMNHLVWQVQNCQGCYLQLSASLMQVSANLALVKCWTLHGVYWGSYAAPGHDPGLMRSLMDHLLHQVSSGEMLPGAEHISRCRFRPMWRL